MYAPVSCEVIEANGALEDTPELVNTDPYGDGWLFKIKLSDPAEIDGLLDAEAYAPIAGRLRLAAQYLSRLPVNEGHQPGRADQQELEVLEKGRALAFENMPDELADPGQYEHRQRRPATEARAMPAR